MTKDQEVIERLAKSFNHGYEAAAIFATDLQDRRTWKGFYSVAQAAKELRSWRRKGWTALRLVNLKSGKELDLDSN